MTLVSPKNISIIIPLTTGEKAWRDLYRDLCAFISGAEIIFVCTQDDDKNVHAIKNLLNKSNQIRCIRARQGRAFQLNAGAKRARRRFLWFLHADSRLTEKSIHSLLKSLHQSPAALHYFNLSFVNDGPALMLVNEAGAWLRSHLFKSPFGDQGFCLPQKLFLQAGGFPCDVSYGEDHVFIWHAQQKNIPIKCVGEGLKTSARKYREQGWLKVTAKHLWLWNKQVWPEYIKYLKS